MATVQSVRTDGHNGAMPATQQKGMKQVRCFVATQWVACHHDSVVCHISKPCSARTMQLSSE